MRLTRARTLTVTALLGASLTLPSTLAGAGVAVWVLPAEPLDRATPTFEFDLQQQECENPVYGVSEPEGYGSEDETVRDDAGLVVDADPSGTSGTFSVAGLEGGEFYFTIECGPDGERFRLPGPFEFRRLTVDKVVEGEVPDGTTFAVQVDCDPSDGSDFEPEPFSVELDYTAEGGAAPVISYDGDLDIDCTVEETDDGGAESVTVDPEQVTFTEGVFNAASTVTNTFPAPEPSPTPTETETEAPTETETPTETESPSPTPTPIDDDVDDDVEEADPATPVPAQPTYTG